MSSGLLQVFVELGNLHGTSSLIESPGVPCSDLVSHNKYSCSQDWTCNLQMIVSLEAEGTNAMCPAGQFRVNFWDLMFLFDKDYYYYV